jgi:hypothetical protein
VAAVGVLVSEQGWSVGAVVIAASGLVIAAGLWWAYYLIPTRTILTRWPERTFAWRYAHLPLFGAIAAVGAGLRVAADGVEHQELTLLQITLALAVPVGCVVVLVFLIWSVHAGSPRGRDRRRRRDRSERTHRPRGRRRPRRARHGDRARVALVRRRSGGARDHRLLAHARRRGAEPAAPERRRRLANACMRADVGFREKPIRPIPIDDLTDILVAAIDRRMPRETVAAGPRERRSLRHPV